MNVHVTTTRRNQVKLTEMSASSDQDPGIAFMLTALAGAATALGAAVVFFPSLVKLASRRVLACALGFSAGVMTYVSFVEIFQKSVVAFEGAEFEDNMAYIYASLSFFGGVVVMKLVDISVRLLSGGHHHHSHCGEEIQDMSGNVEACEACGQRILSPHYVGQSDDPVAELNEWHQRADQEINDWDEHNQRTIASNDFFNDNASRNSSNDDVCEQVMEKEADEFKDDNDQSGLSQPQVNVNVNKKSEEDGVQQLIVENPPDHIKNPDEDRKLITMGLNTAFAIALHNFPEGLATFVAALHDPQVGVVLAIAIGIHNIPEGLCVALPIYYATGNRCKAFWWACLSGASEPLAALLGWAILAKTMSLMVYAILFGLVAGMMVVISMKELLPTAHRYDPEDTVVTYSFVGGMALISLSLMLFKI
ncbi:hypothetical protein HJC23_008116 [Cyclotella cryptica]|uniref:Zinc transporter n=1 Tax=Cyclotella cryptica TaxID=29204 RepID=A0ABD3PDS4_9STRA